jgi:hypothetical protein
MRLYHAAILAASIALPVAISGTTVPAHAQNGALGQVQRFLNGNQQQNQNAYEQGREDQRRRDQAQRAEHPDAQGQYDPRYGQDQRPPPSGYGNRQDNGYGSNYGYNHPDNGYGDNNYER